MKDNLEREIFRKNLAYFVARSGKQQKEIAEDLGEATSTFNNWMIGRSAPNVGKIQKIADYFGIGKSALLEDFEAIEPDAKFAQIVSYIGLNDEESRNMIISYYSLTASKKALVQDLVKHLGN